MAAPAYSNDLTTIATGDLNYDAGTWDESSNIGWDSAGVMVDDENLWYTDNKVNTGEALSSCTSAQYTKDGNLTGNKGPGTIMYTHTGAFSVPTDGVVLIHHVWAAPPALNAYAGNFGTAEAGITVLIGDSVGVFDVHEVSGNDKSPAPEGGWTTYVVDPTLTPAGSIGSPTTTQMVGVGVAAVKQARGNPQACQAVRYGRGEVEYTIGDAATPATFDGYAAIDNAAADRFNLLQIIPGGFKARGLMSFGTAGTAVYFEDADKSIAIADDPRVSSTFNKGVVTNAGSTLKWTNIAIVNLSSIAKYTFTVGDAATTVHTGCLFTDVGAFTYGANSTQTGSTYRRQEPVVQGGSTFTSCIFDKPLATGLTVSDIALVTLSTFNSSGTGHAVDLGVIGADITKTWDNTDADYALTDGSTGNETILVSVDSGITLTISVTDTATVPTVNNTGLGTVTVVSGQKDFTFTVSPNPSPDYEWRLYTVTAEGSLVGAIELDGAERETTTAQVYTHAYTSQAIAVQIISNDYEELMYYDTLTAADKSVTLNLTLDDND